MSLKILSGVDFKWPTRNLMRVSPRSFMRVSYESLGELSRPRSSTPPGSSVMCRGGARFMATPLFVCFGLYDLCVRFCVTFFFPLLMSQFRSLDGLPSSHFLVGLYYDDWWIFSDVIATRYQFNRQTIRNSNFILTLVFAWFLDC